MSVTDLINTDLINNLGVSSLGLWRGTNIRSATLAPQKMLVLYEMEGCPFCRLVREVLTELDLDVLIYPCPKGGSRFRDDVVAKGGKAQFPYLVDDNTGTAMYESAEIISYLYSQYSNEKAPPVWRIKSINTAGAFLASMARMGNGLH